MQELIKNWLSEENLNKAKGKTREELFAEFGNVLEPIAYIDSVYLPYLGDNITDNRVYSGKGYFIDHAVNHHPEVKIEDYDDIQVILSNPDGVFLDDSKANLSIVFVKQYKNWGTVVVGVDNENAKIVLHKSFFSQRKNSYAKFNDIRVKIPLVGGQSTVSPAE
ncbi:hypothetical protein AGMMS49965_19310 [Bacteroidia bacterium]|nr:hypothetical protein AGMMS49965_19310 [Bacteroidia bacterium]